MSCGRVHQSGRRRLRGRPPRKTAEIERWKLFRCHCRATNTRTPMTYQSDTSREIAPSRCRISMTASSKLSEVRMPADMAPAGPIHYDYENDWHLVVPHLSDPSLQQLLDTQ